MPSIDVAPGSPYRHQRLEVPAPPARTRWAFVVAGAFVAGGLALTPGLVPAVVAHPVDTRGVPVSLHVLHLDDDGMEEVEPLRGVVAFVPTPAPEEIPLAVRADGSAFMLVEVSENPRNVATAMGRVNPGRWRTGPLAIEGTVARSCLRLAGARLACDDGAAIREHPCRTHDSRGDDVPCEEGHARCRRRNDGTVECRDGIADGRVKHRQRPRPVASALRFTALAARDYVTCGVTTGGEVACWGPSMRMVGGVGRATAVTVRDGEACALTTDGAVWCWDPAAVPTAHRMELPTAATAVVAGGTATCARTTDGAAWCWGTIGRAWPGHPRAERATRPLDVRLPDAVVSMHATAEGAWCARLRSGELRCWGGAVEHWSEQRETARLGDTALDETWVADGLTVIERSHWLLDDGRVARRDARYVRAIAVLGDMPPAVALVEGTTHSCALARDGVAWCWGGNGAGQLGLDDATSEEQWHIAMIARRAR